MATISVPTILTSAGGVVLSSLRSLMAVPQAVGAAVGGYVRPVALAEAESTYSAMGAGDDRVEGFL